MVSGCGDFQRPFGLRLTAHFREIGVAWVNARIAVDTRAFAQFALPGQVGADLQQRVSGEDAGAVGQRRFLRTFAG